MQQQPQAACPGLPEPRGATGLISHRRLGICWRRPGHRQRPAQPGGWIYNILPYIEQQALHDLGAGLSGIVSRRPRSTFHSGVATPLEIFILPHPVAALALYPAHPQR